MNIYSCLFTLNGRNQVFHISVDSVQKLPVKITQMADLVIVNSTLKPVKDRYNLFTVTTMSTVDEVIDYIDRNIN